MIIKMKNDSGRIKMVMMWAILIIFTGTMHINAALFANHTGGAFEDPPDGGTAYTASSINMSIKDLIVNGAGYFLKAGSDINTLSERFEMMDLEGFDYHGMYNAANSAISNLEMMGHYYGQLTSKADLTPYNQIMINKLSAFNYETFRIQNGLNKDIFKLVKQYLSSGDVRGAYKKIQTDSNNLLNQLYNIRWLIHWGYMPTSQAIWDMNQANMNCHFFGQYLTRVFKEMQKE